MGAYLLSFISLRNHASGNLDTYTRLLTVIEKRLSSKQCRILVAIGVDSILHWQHHSSTIFTRNDYQKYPSHFKDIQDLKMPKCVTPPPTLASRGCWPAPSLRAT